MEYSTHAVHSPKRLQRKHLFTLDDNAAGKENYIYFKSLLLVPKLEKRGSESF